ELIAQILVDVPKYSLLSCRPVSHSFSDRAFPNLFSYISQWLDHNFSYEDVVTIAQNACERPAVMWSPWATGLDGPVEDTRLHIMWKVLKKHDIPVKDAQVILTVDNFAEMSEMEDITSRRFRTAQNRYLLHRAYLNG
ncbi:hypothetical protein BJ878DRAFT_415023, partial [Calycina marina]